MKHWIIFALFLGACHQEKESTKTTEMIKPVETKTIQKVQWLEASNCFVLTTEAWHNHVIVCMLLCYSGRKNSSICCNTWTSPVLNDSVKRAQYNLAEKRRLAWIENITPLK